MKVYDAHHIRNICLMGHAGSGKTTLAEAMLFESKEITRRGSVEEKSTVSDYHDIEHERGSSVLGTVLFAEWKDYKINIIDTPGYDDYVGEVISALRVVDTAIMVLNAAHGVEVGTETLWKYTDQFHTPVIFVANKVDSEQSNFDKTVQQAKERFGRQVTVVQYPLNEGSSFDAIIDVLKMTMYKFPAEGGKPEKLPIPESEREKANELHRELIEIVAENDEELMSQYFEKGELDEDEIRIGLRKAMVDRLICPLFVTSAKKDMGSGRIMGFIDNVVPAPVEMPPKKTVDGKDLVCDPQGKPSLFVFKSMSEPHLGEMSFFRVYSGTIHHGHDLVNEQTDITERLGQIFAVNGKRREDIAHLYAGDIGATVKLKNTHVNNTLHEKGEHLVLPSIEFPAPKVRIAVHTTKKGEEDKLGMALHHLHEEDPTLVVEHSQELKQTLILGQGEMHLGVAKWRLQNRFKVDIEFTEPKVPYRETIQKSIKGMYRHKKQSGGAGQFAEVHMIVEPYHEGMPHPHGVSVRGEEKHELPWGGQLVFLNCIVGGVIEARFMPAILKGVLEKMHEGPITGSYVRDIRVSVFDGKMHPVDSNEAAFKTAGRMAFRDCFIQADPKLLEPIYDVEIVTPDDYMGEIMSDIPARRSIIMGMEADGHYQRIKCRMPLSELDKYSSSLRSMSQGRATFSSGFAEYAAVPAQLQQKLHNEYVAHQHDEE